MTHDRSMVFSRVFSKLIDLTLVIALANVFYPVGPLVGFLYSLFGDSVGGQSIGKKMLSLRVVGRISRQPGGIKDSLIRNAPVGVATLFGFIPIWGWLVLGLVGIPLMIVEVYLMATVGKGVRLGDAMADTEVISTKP